MANYRWLFTLAEVCALLRGFYFCGILDSFRDILLVTKHRLMLQTHANVLQLYANLWHAGWRHLISHQKQPRLSRCCPLAEPCRTANRSQPALRHLGSLSRRISALCHLSAVLPAVPIRSSAHLSTEPFAACLVVTSMHKFAYIQM